MSTVSKRQSKKAPQTRRKKAQASAKSPIPIDRRRHAVVRGKKEIVHAVFPGHAQSEHAVEALKKAGFQEEEISACRIERAGDGSRAAAARPLHAHEPDSPEGVVPAAARLFGSAVSLGLLALAAPVTFLIPGMPGPRQQTTEAPMLVAVQTDTPNHAGRAAETLLRTGGQRVALSGEYVFARENSPAGQSLRSSAADS